LALFLWLYLRIGEVLIKRKDGQIFSMKPEKSKKSPLSVKGIRPFITTKELVEVIREQRSEKRAGALKV
jgi:hypothetical protein